MCPPVPGSQCYQSEMQASGHMDERHSPLSPRSPCFSATRAEKQPGCRAKWPLGPRRVLCSLQAQDFSAATGNQSHSPQEPVQCDSWGTTKSRC